MLLPIDLRLGNTSLAFGRPNVVFAPGIAYRRHVGKVSSIEGTG